MTPDCFACLRKAGTTDEHALLAALRHPLCVDCLAEIQARAAVREDSERRASEAAERANEATWDEQARDMDARAEDDAAHLATCPNCIDSDLPANDRRKRCAERTAAREMVGAYAAALTGLPAHVRRSLR